MAGTRDIVPHGRAHRQGRCGIHAPGLHRRRQARPAARLSLPPAPRDALDAPPSRLHRRGPAQGGTGSRRRLRYATREHGAINLESTGGRGPAASPTPAAPRWMRSPRCGRAPARDRPSRDLARARRRLSPPPDPARDVSGFIRPRAASDMLVSACAGSPPGRCEATLARHLRDEAGPLVRGQVGYRRWFTEAANRLGDDLGAEAVALLVPLVSPPEPEVRHLRLPDRNGALAKAAG